MDLDKLIAQTRPSPRPRAKPAVLPPTPPVEAPAPRTRPAWGLSAAVPEGAPASWGARAIFGRTQMDLLPDRQDLVGEEPHRTALLTILNDAGRLAFAQAKYRDAVATGRVRPDEAGYVVLDRFDDAYTFAVNTHASHGYVCAAAWIAPPPDLSKVERAGGACAANVRVPRPGEILWSHPGPIPAVGDVVVNRCNNIGRCTVLGYGVTDGWLYLLAWPSDPPAWYRRQNGTTRDGVPTWGMCGIFGADLTYPEVA